MNFNEYPHDVQLFINEFTKERILSDELIDETFINYLYFQKYDADYIDYIRNDRNNS